MQYKKYFSFTIFFILLFSFELYGQSVLKLTPYNGNNSSFIFEQIKADTAANHGIPADRVYELEGGQIYLCIQIFYVASGQKLRLRSSNGEKAIIYLYPSGTGSSPQNPPGYFVRQRGGDLEMSGIELVGFFEPDWVNFDNIQGGMLRTDTEGSSIILDNCIFENINGQIIRTEGATKTIKVTNCIFANMGAVNTSNFGAGKGLDLRTNSCDSLILVNNTFTNYQDRVIRHYNIQNPVSGTGAIGYALIDHNTFYDGMGFHGLLSLGDVGNEVTISNNLFVDAFASGEDPSDSTRTQEFGSTGDQYPNGYNKMYWIFTSPNDTTEWNVTKNYYAISAEGQAFFDNNPPIVAGDILSTHIVNRLGSAAASAFTKIDDPGFIVKQKLMINLMEWYISPTGGNRTKNTPTALWDPATDDMDRRLAPFWADTLNLAYSENSTAYSGTDKGYPAGDLNWFPDLKTKWEQGIDLTDAVQRTDALPTAFVLEQNYPNPFNPTTNITYNVPTQSRVKLEVFDILGRHVATLVDGVQAPGQYKVDFDASKLSSGVYVYQLSTQNQLFTKKMMLLK